jgi:hypothetical protein
MVTLTLLAVAGMFVGLYVEKLQGIAGGIQKVRFATIGVMLIFAFVLYRFRRNPGTRMTLSIFVLCFWWLIFLSTVSHFQHANSDKPWVPFIDQKLFFFGLSVFVVGPVWINAVAMLIVVLQVFTLWFMTDLGDTSQFTNAWEPWYTLYFAAVSYVLLAFRFYHESALRKLTEEKVRLHHTEYLAHVFSSIQGLSNRPLQKLRLSAELLASRRVTPETVRDEISVSTERLTSLGRIFKVFEKRFAPKDPTPMTEAQILASLKELECD